MNPIMQFGGGTFSFSSTQLLSLEVCSSFSIASVISASGVGGGVLSGEVGLPGVVTVECGVSPS